MKSLIVLQHAFLAIEFLFYSFRALSTYIFETYFTFFSCFVAFTHTYLTLMPFACFSFVLRLLFFIVFWNHRFTFLFVCLPQFLSKLTEKDVPARFLPLLHPCKWSMHWSPQDSICYRKHGHATDVLLLLYCICEPFGQEYRLHTLFCCRTAQSRGAFLRFVPMSVVLCNVLRSSTFLLTFPW